MSVASNAKSKKSAIIKMAICIVLTIICLVIPEQGFYTEQVKYFLAITVFCLALSATETIPDFAVAIILPALWLFFGVSDWATVMSAWTSPTMLLTVGAFFMAASLEDCGLLRRVAFFLMCKVKSNYFLLLLALMVVGIIVNILTFGSAFILVPAIAVGLVASLDGFGKRFSAGLGAAALLGCATSHAYTYSSANWGVINAVGADILGDDRITPLSMIVHNFPLFFISVGILFIAYLMYKPDEPLGDITYFENQLRKMGKLTRREKANAIVLAILVLYAFTVQKTGLSLELGFALIPFLLFFPGIDGADNKTIDKTNFKMVFFVGSCMAIGTVAASLGLADILFNACLDLINGSNNVMVIIAMVFAIVFLLNFLLTPLAIFSILTIPLLTVATNLGLNPVPFAYTVNACAEAILLPYEYMPYLVIYGFGLMKFKDFFVFNLIKSIIILFGVIFIMTGYWNLIGLL